MWRLTAYADTSPSRTGEASAPNALKELKAQGIRLLMLTATTSYGAGGCAQPRHRRFQSEVLPGAKSGDDPPMQSEGHVVAMAATALTMLLAGAADVGSPWEQARTSPGKRRHHAD